MSAAVQPAPSGTRCYQRRRPEHTLWYRTVQAHFETWLAVAAESDQTAPPAYVEQAFRRYLECGVLSCGFARAFCDECGRDFLVAFSCQGRAVCPSCNARRMVATAAHLSDHVLPPLPLRQWVLSVPKRLRYFLHDDAVLQGVVVRILLRAVERCLREHSPGCTSAARLGAVVFIHRFGSSLNAHLHFHCCILDGVFEAAHATDAAAGVAFHEASGLAAAAVATVQTQVRQRVLRAFVRRGLLEQRDSEEMGGWAHGGGFSLDAAVRIEGADLAGRERLLRYCARPPFALHHLHQHDAEHLLYDIPKPRPDGPRALVLTPLELIDKIAALVPPPRVHRHRYYGVLAPNAPLRAAVTALAPVPAPPPAAGTPEDAPHRAAARYLWAMLLARIYEVFPLRCSFCHAAMRIIAFITAPCTRRQILEHLAEPTRPPRFAPARGPPLWEVVAAAPPADNDPRWEQAAQPLPEIEFDQRLAW
jgi:Putative transposase/Transposase zinc-binding domain